MSMSDIASIIWIALAVYVFCGMRKWNKRFAELYEELRRWICRQAVGRNRKGRWGAWQAGAIGRYMWCAHTM